MPVNIIKVARIDSEEARKALHNEVMMYVNSTTRNAGFDLSQISILRSEQIGFLAQAIKAADQRNGRIVLWVAQHALVQLLIAVHFDKKASIVRTEEEFKELLEADATTAASAPPPAGKRTQPLSADKTPKKDDLPRIGEILALYLAKRPVQLGMGFAVVVLFLGLISMTVILLLQGRILRETQQRNAVQEYRIDSLNTIVNRFQEEEKLMDEITANGKKGKTANAK
ncbi:MAG: hypothetical protein V1913_00130 [Fibrobacterota bacterium]